MDEKARARTQRRGGYATLVLGLLGVVFALSWSFAARSLLSIGAKKQSERGVEQAESLFDYRVKQIEERLKSECGLIGGDPRLRSALATPGIDESTIADILVELRKLTNADMLAVLDPTGRVQSVVGEDSFRGLDLSTSRFVREARDSNSSVTGVWVLGNDVLFIGAFAIRFGDRVVAYLIHGHSIEAGTLSSIYTATGTGMALVAAGKIAMLVPEGDAPRAAAEQTIQVGSTGPFQIGVGNQQFIGRVRQVQDTLPPAYIVWLRSSGDVPPEYEVLGNLVWVPVLLTFALALLFGWRSTSR